MNNVNEELLLTNKRILLGVTGGIAAYKAAELLRRLQDKGADVRVVMTSAATEFITPLTMQALSGHPVHLDLLDTDAENAMGHIELARWADLILIAPASANFIARLRHGQADDLLSTLCLAAHCPIALAPAMNQGMWENQSTQDNIESLKKTGIQLFGPESGSQACGETGFGRLLEIPAIIHLTLQLFSNGALAGKRVVITAGPTREAIDPVRYISNHSSGKQGYALATSAMEAGAEVILISGPTQLPEPSRVKRINVVSANEMFDAVMGEIKTCDVFIGVAAVADFRPTNYTEQKMKKDGTGHTDAIALTLNPDIVASVAGMSPKPFTVGFAAETESLIANAKQKLVKKNLDMIVANDVSDSRIGFNSADNATTIFWSEGEVQLPLMSKQQISNSIIEIIAKKLK
ncbi:MAG: phosphopantothenoylcysteine decarboxylase/phosphopantothenate--cysteine ligase [Candidatus Azotimanducaceae bacterium]|jgi:phosphopantothenoylcysteine decarboxylase/phosphopantothenate--cysteine ligase